MSELCLMLHQVILKNDLDWRPTFSLSLASRSIMEPWIKHSVRLFLRQSWVCFSLTVSASDALTWFVVSVCVVHQCNHTLLWHTIKIAINKTVKACLYPVYYTLAIHIITNRYNYNIINIIMIILLWYTLQLKTCGSVRLFLDFDAFNIYI